MVARAFENKSLPIIAVVDKVEKYTVQVKEEPSDEIKKTLNDAGSALISLQVVFGW